MHLVCQRPRSWESEGEGKGLGITEASSWPSAQRSCLGQRLHMMQEETGAQREEESGWSQLMPPLGPPVICGFPSHLPLF